MLHNAMENKLLFRTNEIERSTSQQMSVIVLIMETTMSIKNSKFSSESVTLTIH